MAKTARKPREPKAKQGHLDGMAPPSIKEIDKAAERFRECRNERMELSQEEAKCRDLLEAVMKKNELRVYEYDGQVVEIVYEEKVRVRKKKPDGTDDE